RPCSSRASDTRSSASSAPSFALASAIRTIHVERRGRRPACWQRVSLVKPKLPSELRDGGRFTRKLREGLWRVENSLSEPERQPRGRGAVPARPHRIHSSLLAFGRRRDGARRGKRRAP